MLELSVAVGVVGAFARLAVGLQAEVEALQQAADQLLTGDEAPLGQRCGGMALARADPPQRSLWVTADRRLHQLIQSIQDPRLHHDRGLLSTTPAANPLAALHRPGPEVRQTAADCASGNSGGPRNRNNSAAAGSACFTGREQASVSFVAERSECIVAGPDGILVDHPATLDAKTPDSHRLFGVVRCVIAALWSLFYRVACSGSGPKGAIRHSAGGHRRVRGGDGRRAG